MTYDNENKRPPITEEKALARMMRICARKEYCTHDIYQKLYQLKLDEEAIDRIITQLHENKFIDDLRFTRSYINDKLRFTKWGKVKITHHLRHKRVPDAIINEAFEEFNDEQLTEALEPLLIKRLKTVKGDSDYDKRNKVIRYALGRGFEMGDILDTLDQLQKEE